MSRITKKVDHYEVAYGYDTVFGFFMQVFDTASNDPEDRIVLDLEHLTLEQLTRELEEYNVNLTLDELDALATTKSAI